jgi:DNA-binding HxlR family transcriptional regulator
MTKKEMFIEIRNIVSDNEEMIAFIDHEIELLERKSNSPKKPTKTQVENDGFKAEIVAYLTEVDTPKTIKELQAEIPSISGLTNQRITHMLTDLVKAETLTKEYVKKTPYYSVA